MIDWGHWLDKRANLNEEIKQGTNNYFGKETNVLFSKKRTTNDDACIIEDSKTIYKTIGYKLWHN